MKKICLLATLLLIGACSTSNNKNTSEINFISDNVKTPESVYQDPQTKLIFISNIDGAPTDKNKKGYITLLDENAKVKKVKWINGLNAPKGLRSYKNVLWVTDIDRVHAINISEGVKIGSIKVQGAKFLNDIAIDGEGSVFVSDMLTNKIHKITNGKVSTFIEGDNLAHPNGLLVNDNKLFVASWGMKMKEDFSTETPGSLYSIDLKNKEIIKVTSPFGNLDGIELDNQGNFLISDWIAGKVYRVTSNGDVEEIYSGQKGTADIGFLSSSNEVLIPLMLSNQVISIKI